jgi:hypothetical protein
LIHDKITCFNRGFFQCSCGVIQQLACRKADPWATAAVYLSFSGTCCSALIYDD